MGSMQAISANSTPEKAMEFLNLLNTDVYLRNPIGSPSGVDTTG